MSGMVKEVKETQVKEHQVSQGVIPADNPDALPRYLENYFNVSLPSQKETEDLKRLHNLLINRIPEMERSEGFLWKHLNDLEVRLGQGRVGEKAYSKILAYLEINQQIKDMEAKREALIRR